MHEDSRDFRPRISRQHIMYLTAYSHTSFLSFWKWNDYDMVVLLHAIEVHGRKKIQLPSFFTLAMAETVRSTSGPCRFTLQKELPIPTELGIGWTPEPVWIFWRREKSLVSNKNQRTVPQFSSVQLIHYTNWAILTHYYNKEKFFHPRHQAI